MSPQIKLRIAIADDHAAIRAGVRALLRDCEDLEVVAEAGDAAEAVRVVRLYEPDILLLDLGMPGGGLKAIEHALDARPSLRVLVFTMHDSLAYLRAAMAAGAHGYVVKTASREELIRALRAIRDGRVYADVSVRDSTPAPAAREAGKSPMSGREREVLTALAEGYSQREVAERLELSVRTVETYRKRIAEKLGLLNRADIVRYALETGLLRSDAGDEPKPGKKPSDD